MLPRAELRKLARARLVDAQVLFDSRRYDGAMYVCGYAVELALKARISRTLKWQGYPETNNEFKQLNNFRTHDFEILPSLSGVAHKIKSNHMADWSRVSDWKPDFRYRPYGTAAKDKVEAMLLAAENLIRALA